MRWLRALLGRLGRWLERLGRFLVAWAKPAFELNAESGWVEGPGDGPPEHWLRHLRQRSPWLLRREAPGPAASAAGAASVAGKQAPDVIPPQGASAPDTARGVMRRAERRHNPRPLRPLRPDLGTGAAPPSARATPTSPRAPAPVVAVPHPRPQAAVARPAETGTKPVAESTRPPSHWVRFKGARVTPRPEPASEQPGESGATDATPSAEPSGWPPDPPRTASFHQVTLRARPDAEIETMALRSVTAPGSQAGAEPVREAAVQRPSDEEPAWPELPDIPWSEDAWSVPSRQALMKEQQRLTRLRAEQAGSSWSGPLS